MQRLSETAGMNWWEETGGPIVIAAPLPPIEEPDVDEPEQPDADDDTVVVGPVTVLGAPLTTPMCARDPDEEDEDEDLDYLYDDEEDEDLDDDLDDDLDEFEEDEEGIEEEDEDV